MNKNNFIDMLKNHELTQIQSGTVSAYMLKKPGDGRMCSCMIIFSPEGIVVMGDLCPGLHGTISCYGYGVGWFAGELSRYYLAEKFLRKEFVPEIAAEELRDPDCYLREDATKEQLENIDRMATMVDCGEAGPEALYDLYCELGACTADGCVGWTYNPRDLDLLQAIQMRFAELYHQMPQLEVENAKPQKQYWWHKILGLFGPKPLTSGN